MNLLKRIEEQYGETLRKKRACVLAFTGGLDSTVTAAILMELGLKVHTVTIDIGQKKDLRAVAEKAKAIGVNGHYNVLCRDEFLGGYVNKSIHANCFWEGELNSEALSRPLLIKHLVEVARSEAADTIVHSSTAIGNGQLRMDNGIRALAPEMSIIASVRDWNMSREEELEYAKTRKLPLTIDEKPHAYSSDENIWGRSVKGGEVENPDEPVPETVYKWTNPIGSTPEKPVYAEIFFEKGTPELLKVLDHEKKEITETRRVVETLNEIGGLHGVGRIEHMEDKAIGLKMREVYEAPAAAIIIGAHRDLERLVLTARELEVKEFVDRQWNHLVDEGLWFTDLRDALEAFIEKTQERVTGKVTMCIHKGNASPAQRESKYAVYDTYLSTTGKKGVWNTQDAKSFSKLYGLQETIAYLVRNTAEETQYPTSKNQKKKK